MTRTTREKEAKVVCRCVSALEERAFGGCRPKNSQNGSDPNLSYTLQRILGYFLALTFVWDTTLLLSLCECRYYFSHFPQILYLN